MAQRALILGAAGRDFHNFNTYFRGNSDYEVVAFTATQIPNIDGRLYPAELAGSMYPNGIPIEPENNLIKLIQDKEIDVAVFSYSDISHESVMHLGSRCWRQARIIFCWVQNIHRSRHTFPSLLFALREPAVEKARPAGGLQVF